MAPFPFFRLARELRDQIYAELGGELLSFNLTLPASTSQNDQTTLSAIVSSAPTTKLLLVSRDFTREYEMESRRHMSLCILTPIQSEHLPMRVLKKDSRAHRYIRNIPYLTMKIWQHDSEKPCTTVRDGLLPYMDSLKSIKNALFFNFQRDGSGQEAVLDESAFTVRSLTLPGRSHDIVLHTQYFYNCRQLSLAKNYHFTREVAERWPSFVGDPGMEFGATDRAQHHHKNAMVYQVLPVADQNGRFVGVDYKIFSDEDFVVEDVMDSTEEMMRWVEADW